MFIIKKEYQLDHYCLAITRQRSCCITYFVDFTYYKTDITALNAIIKYSLGWALLLPRLLSKLMNFSQKHSGDKFHTEKNSKCFNSDYGAQER
jgi:hypothetical protein